MKTRLYFLFFLFLLTPSALAVDLNYYIMDSVTYNGVRLVDYGINENVNFCHEMTNGNLTRFTPYQVDEYSIGGKLLYVARDIMLDGVLKRVFLEKRVFGVYAQYHYLDRKNDLFFLQKGMGPMLELPKNDLSEFFNMEKLTEYTKGCPKITAKSPKVSYSATDLSFYLQQVADCRINPFPPMRVGVSMGINFTKLQPFAGFTDPDYRIFNYKYEVGPSLGFFLDQPILQFGISIHAGMNYSSNVFSYQKHLERTHTGILLSTDYNFVTTLHTLELPINLRYTLPLSTLRPYFEFGGFINWNFYNDSYVDRVFLENDSRLVLGSLHSPVLDRLNVGPSIGVGVECPLNGRHQIFLECHYTQTTGIMNPDLCSLSRFALTAGYYF